MEDAERKVLFSGEAQLTAWGESSTTGAWVKLWVHPEDLESFKTMKLRVGRTAGQRLGVAIVQLGDDEAIVEHHDGQAAAPAPAPEPPPPRPVPDKFKPHIGALGMLAVRWCKDRDFQQWLAFGDASRMVFDEAAAKEFVLEQCGVIERYGNQASRKHLDIDPDCAALFDQRIRIPFRDWLAEQGIQK